ncbi:hypothetical protein [Pseudobdellovibrio exovorus]|uniref:Uncharacterized protein n=1 Tax=Pseudobdellovibrio exovorus JSS TaxID=1184267 RepID=M4VMW2_9BACT|nr:hypothetical protein [Pseudobdellovibrio exovorus]AGH94429.1 hypothetical protein A11Q_209 [Pseudobdellovibrio exovorus JSS]
MDSYLLSCLSSVSCQLDSRQRVVLQNILNGLPSERLNQNLIQFYSESNYPGFFVIDSEVKVAKTGSTPGSPIYINTDMIYTLDHIGYKVPIGIPEILAILIHELGHHYGSESHEFLDLLGVRVGMFISQQSYMTAPLPWMRGFGISAINTSNDVTTFPDVMLFLGDEAINISEEVKKSALCLYQLYFGAETETRRPTGIFMYNLHWSFAKQRGDLSSDLTMTALVTYNCEYGLSYKSGRQEHSLMVRLKARPSKTGVGYNVKRVMVEQKDGATYTPRR